jgi:hypothetical protein
VIWPEAVENANNNEASLGSLLVAMDCTSAVQNGLVTTPKTAKRNETNLILLC